MNQEFINFHYHASCTVTSLARMVLLFMAGVLKLALRGVDYLDGKLTEPERPEVVA